MTDSFASQREVSTEEKNNTVSSRTYRIILFSLVVFFIIYNLAVYSSDSYGSDERMSAEALAGQTIWQENNCAACHQLYGLGGYLGPDLTNITSNPKKGEDYVKALLNTGVKSMPKFNFNEEEKEQLVAFLRHVDKTGYFPNKKAKILNNGWVELKYKDKNE